MPQVRSFVDILHKYMARGWFALIVSVQGYRKGKEEK